MTAEDLCRIFKGSDLFAGTLNDSFDLIDRYMYKSDSDLYSVDSTDDGPPKAVPPEFKRGKISKRLVMKGVKRRFTDDEDAEDEGETI